MMLAVIVHGPQACGKSRNRAAIRDAYGLTGITEDWEPGDPVTQGFLHLTYAPLKAGNYGGNPAIQVVPFDQAMQRVAQMKGGAE